MKLKKKYKILCYLLASFFVISISSIKCCFTQNDKILKVNQNLTSINEAENNETELETENQNNDNNYTTIIIISAFSLVALVILISLILVFLKIKKANKKI